MAQGKRLTYYEQRGNKMTLQKIVDILQTWAHHGHAQDQVVVGDKSTVPEDIIIRAFGSGQIMIDLVGANDD